MPKDEEHSIIPGSGVKPSDIKSWVKLWPIILPLLFGGAATTGSIWTFDLFGVETLNKQLDLCQERNKVYLNALGVPVTRSALPLLELPAVAAPPPETD